MHLPYFLLILCVPCLRGASQVKTGTLPLFPVPSSQLSTGPQTLLQTEAEHVPDTWLVALELLSTMLFPEHSYPAQWKGGRELRGLSENPRSSKWSSQDLNTNLFFQQINSSLLPKAIMRLWLW